MLCLLLVSCSNAGFVRGLSGAKVFRIRVYFLCTVVSLLELWFGHVFHGT